MAVRSPPHGQKPLRSRAPSMSWPSEGWGSFQRVPPFLGSIDSRFADGLDGRRQSGSTPAGGDAEATSLLRTATTVRPSTGRTRPGATYRAQIRAPRERGFNSPSAPSEGPSPHAPATASAWLRAALAARGAPESSDAKTIAQVVAVPPTGASGPSPLRSRAWGRSKDEGARRVCHPPQ